MEPDPYRLLADGLAGIVRDAVRQAMAEALADRDNDATMISVPEAAVRLGVGKTKLNQLIVSGNLPSVLLGKRRLLRPADLEAFAARHGNGNGNGNGNGK